MTVSSSTNRWNYTGNGVTTDFAYDNLIFASSDLKVYLDGVLQASGYTVTNVLVITGGNVSFTVAPANNVAVTIVRDVPHQQPTDLVDNGKFPADTTERALDRVTVLSQQNKDAIDRALRQPETDTVAISRLPDKATRASKFAAYDGDGNPIAAAGTSANLGPVSAFINTLLDDASAPAARATLGAAASATTVTTTAPLSGGGDLSANRTLVLQMGFGQCRLTKSGANLLLSRHNGRFLFINGALEQIPSAGVTLAAAGVRGAVQISNRERNANVATLTFPSAHGYAVGDIVSVFLNSLSTTAGGYCGNHTVASVPSSTTLTFANTGSNEASIASTTISAVPIYYIYAYMNAGVMTLEVSPTVPAVDATHGHKIKTGNATHTLVGMAISDAGAAWEDTETQRHVLSYFNRSGTEGRNAVTTNFSFTSTSLTELSLGHRISFLTWSDELVQQFLQWHSFHDTAGANMWIALRDDAGASHDCFSKFSQNASVSNSMTQNLAFAARMSEGRHHMAVQGRTGVGTMTVEGAAAGSIRSTHRVLIVG